MRLGSRRRSRRPEVLISPLIDVIFLLLIFYAVTTQFVTDQRLKLKLPEARTAEETAAGQGEQIPVVTVSTDGAVFIDGSEVPEAALEREMERVVQESPGKAVILKGDRGADYGIVVRVLDVARSAGAESIQMSAVKPPE